LQPAGSFCRTSACPQGRGPRAEEEAGESRLCSSFEIGVASTQSSGRPFHLSSNLANESWL